MAEPDLATTEDWCVFAMDETLHWNLLEWVPEGIRIEGIYLVDRSRAVHLCEGARSYECWSCFSSRYILPEGVELTDEQNEKLRDFIEEGDSWDEPITYWHRSDLDAKFGWEKEDKGPTWERLRPEIDAEELEGLDEDRAYHKTVGLIMEVLNEEGMPLS